MHHPAIDRRSLMMHRIIAERLCANPALVGTAREIPTLHFRSASAAERRHLNSRGQQPTEPRMNHESRVSGVTIVANGRPYGTARIVSPRRGSHLPLTRDRGLSPTAIHVAPLCGSWSPLRLPRPDMSRPVGALHGLSFPHPVSSPHETR